MDHIDMRLKSDPRNKFAVERLMADVNAAIDGAFLGGATHVTVMDGHARGGNFIFPLLDSRAEFDDRDNGRKWWGKLDETYDGSFFIGAHAMMGTINAFLDHTQDSMEWFDYYVNGRKVGELGQWGMVAAHFGVPVVMVSGDEAACAEARQFFKPVECAAVKRGNGRNRAETFDLALSENLIREAAKNAVLLTEKAKLFKPVLPMELKLTLCRSDYCDRYAEREGTDRLDARTVRRVSNSYLDLFF